MTHVTEYNPSVILKHNFWRVIDIFDVQDLAISALMLTGELPKQVRDDRSCLILIKYQVQSVLLSEF